MPSMWRAVSPEGGFQEQPPPVWTVTTAPSPPAAYVAVASMKSYEEAAGVVGEVKGVEGTGPLLR